jgi:hypothetical protein
VVVATSVEDLHSDNNKLNKQNDLSEKGEVINGYGDKPNRHDVLTGSQRDGTAFAADKDMTCQNWTSSTAGSAMLGHADRKGPREDDVMHSWNSSHPSRGAEGGCLQADLRATGGAGLLYCFAVNLFESVMAGLVPAIDVLLECLAERRRCPRHRRAKRRRPSDG